MNEALKGQRLRKDIRDGLRRKARGFRTRTEFFKYARAAYEMAREYGELDYVCQDMKGQRLKWTKSKVLEEALKYKTRWSFYKGARGAYKAMNRLGIEDEAMAHMPEVAAPGAQYNGDALA